MTIEDTTWPDIMPPYEEATPPEPDPAPVVEAKRKTTGNRKDCEVCGKNYSIKHLYSHKRNVHGIFGGRTGITRAPYKHKNHKTAEVAAVPKSNGHKNEPLPPLTAEQITRAAAEALWPDNIPHDKLPALLRWTIQTHFFLSEVQQ